MIFISHRSLDKNIVDIFVDFLKIIGVPSDDIFCSSLPGNDIKSKIDIEIRENLEKSNINIIFLSYDYYKSAYCQNEAGIIWFLDRENIIIALPEINENNMFGFIDHNNKLRRLDVSSDISSIYDVICTLYNLKNKASVINRETEKLIFRYNNIMANRKIDNNKGEIYNDKELTDDEAAIIYYLWKNKKRKIGISDINLWLQENEIYNIDVANGIDLLVESNKGKIEEGGEVFVLSINQFRALSLRTKESMQDVKLKLSSHYYPSKQVFLRIWDTIECTNEIMLFISYIREERMIKFGDRWMAEMQITDIQRWENKNSLMSCLSIKYGSCLQFFIENKFVYASDFTSHGNAREYKLHKTLKEFLFSEKFPYSEKLALIKEKYKCDNLPF